MKTKELVKGLKAMYEWSEDFGFDSEVCVKCASGAKFVYALEVVEEIIKRLEELEKLKKGTELYAKLITPVKGQGEDRKWKINKDILKEHLSCLELISKKK